MRSPKYPALLPLVAIVCLATGGGRIASAHAPQSPAVEAASTRRAHLPADRRIAPDVADAMRANPQIELAAVGRYGTASVLRGEIGRIQRASREDVPEPGRWREALDRVAGAFRVKATDLAPNRSWTDALGTTHVRYTQRKHGLPVVGAALSLHADGEGRVYAAFGNVRDEADAPKPAQARINRRAAERIALAQPGVDEAGEATLVYVVTSDTQAIYLAWQVPVQGRGERVPLDADLFVDATSGNVVDRHSHIHEVMFRKVYKYANGAPPDMDPSTPWPEYPADYPVVLFQDEAGNRSAQVASGAYYWDLTSPNLTSVAQANWGALKAAYDFFKDEHGRDSYDGAGGQLIAEVNGYDLSQPTGAYWGRNSRKLVFGSGDGVTRSALAADPDVVAHELAHGVTQYTSQLIYRFESGALNESFSDIVAAAAQWKRELKPQLIPTNYDHRTHSIWKMGESCETPGVTGDALRYLYDPYLDYNKRPLPHLYSRDYYPDRYQVPVGTVLANEHDEGGVHFNSGIPNLAFYLLAMGGQHPRGKTSITVPYVGGIDAAQWIFYRAFTTYLGPGAQMIDARYATVQAAADREVLLGLPGLTTATALAWDAVGVPALQNNTHPVNLSTRSYVGTGNDIMIAGFVLSGAGTKPLLLRGIGPRLMSFGVPDILVDPETRLSAGATQLAANDNWGSLATQPVLVSTTSSLGAFSLVDNSADSAMLWTLGAGSYTLQLSGKGGGTGNGMVEVYDAAPGTPPVLKNLSTRCVIRPGEPAIAGVVVQGQAHKWLLIRAAGPRLGALGVPGAHPDPKITVFAGQTQIYSNDDWYRIDQYGQHIYDPEVLVAAASVGAFSFSSPSKDAALLLNLPPGSYTVHAGVASGSVSGLVLFEIYDVSETR